MNSSIIISILETRMAVYKAGVMSGCWKDIEQSSASSMMDYLFIKSGHIAFYNIILEQMHKEHCFLPSGAYSLFKMPPQVEKQILDYLKSNKVDLYTLVDDPSQYLKELNTIVTDHYVGEVCIGSFSLNEIDNLMRLCASHYLYSFENNVKSFPYFE